MPLMTNPSRRQRRSSSGVPRLRNRSLPRLRIGGKNNNSNNTCTQSNQPQHQYCEEDETIAKDLHRRLREGPTKARRRSYSLPKRLITTRRPESKEVVIDVREESLNESSSTEVEVSLRRRQRVAFGDAAIVEENHESPLDNQEDLDFDATQVWYQESDYVRFQKDRILTSFDYQASVTNSKIIFDHDAHAIRGLEMVIHPRYSKKLYWEKKDLWKALQKEEAHQKETGKFPNFERFKVVSQRHTKDAKSRATSLGAEDAKDVQGKSGKSWFSRTFGAPAERGVQRHRSMDSEL